MNDKLRVTAHNARTGKDGVFTALHNDRNFDISHAEHIDPERVGQNFYWCYYDGMTFDDAERKFYDTYLTGALDNRNAGLLIKN